MYKKIGVYIDKKNFGSKIIVYKGSQDYFVVIKDREETVYYFVDDNLEKIYPMNSYAKKIGFIYRKEINLIDFTNIDLSLYGHFTCPEYLRKIIQNIIKP